MILYCTQPQAYMGNTVQLIQYSHMGMVRQPCNDLVNVLTY